MSYDPYKSLYIHIPFCIQKCNYCDFCSRVRDPQGVEVREYCEGIVKQIRHACKEGKLSEIETIYIGGGTPTYIGNSNLSSILYAISMSINIDGIKEFTVEANPESINEAIIKDMWAMGVNRLSMGVQSFNDNLLKMLGRAHDAKNAMKAIEIAKKRFENISIDLICGIPGQTEKDFESTLNQAIELNLPHISIYPLSIENNTVFYKWKTQGKIDDVDSDAQADHMLLAADLLSNAGYGHYEIANYAKPGFESKHNLSYWQCKPYLGIGQSATTMTQNNEKRMRVTDNHVEDILNSKEMLAENLMLAMRTRAGINKLLYNEADKAFPTFKNTLDKLFQAGLIVEDASSIKPTEKGWLCGNDLFLAFLDLSNI